MDFFKEDTEYLKVNSDRINDYIDYINKNNVKNIIINKAWGYSHKNIDFVRKCSKLEGIFVVDSDVDISGIEELKYLKILITSSNPSSNIDLSTFEKLEELRIDYNKRWINLGLCENLRKLRIDSYKEKSLTSLLSLGNLEYLKIIKGNLTSLRDLCFLNKLKSFEGFALNKLLNISYSNSCEENMVLREIKLENCKRIADYESIKLFKGIKTLYIINCADIQNLSFVGEMKEIEDFRITNTMVVDGNMNPLKGIKNIYFTNKRHYNLKYEDFLRGNIGFVE